MILYNIYENNEDNCMVCRLTVVLMNLVSLPLIFMWTITGFLLFPLGFLYMKLFLNYSSVFITRKCIWIYGRVWQKILGPFVQFVPPGISGWRFNEPGIIVVNHRSFFDTYCMNMMPVSDVCFAVRAWPFKIPLYNIFMRMAGYINIESDSWETALAVSKQNLEKGSYILFFPEGHRSRNDQMTRFYSGAFKMAVENNVPVIPICITGTQDLLPPKRRYLKPARIKMKILDPVDPNQFDGETRHLDLQKYVKTKMTNCILQMEANTTIDQDNR